MISQPLSGSLIQPVVVEDRAGANGNLRAGRLKVLGVSKRTRMPLVDEVPTLAEQDPFFERERKRWGEVVAQLE